jgi:hypothetical protein
MGAARAEGEEWGDLTGSWQTYTIWAPKWYEPFCCQGLSVRGSCCRGSRECVAKFWNSPRDWSGSERTGNRIVLPVVEAANKL